MRRKQANSQPLCKYLQCQVRTSKHEENEHITHNKQEQNKADAQTRAINSAYSGDIYIGMGVTTTCRNKGVTPASGMGGEDGSFETMLHSYTGTYKTARDVVTRRRIDCEQLCGSINQQLIAGRFGHKGFHQLRTKQFCTQLTKPLWPKRPAIIH